jgi:ribosomal-protein-alanine N-acetyltransferase
MSKFLRHLFGATQPSIGEAALRDAPAIARLHGESFQRGWSEDEVERLLLDRNVLAHRATIGGRLCGFIVSRIAADEAEILSVAVAASERDRGLARQLLATHLGRLAGLGVRQVFLEVGADNEAACRLYERAGFREVGRRAGYYPAGGRGGIDALVLRRDLA